MRFVEFVAWLADFLQRNSKFPEDERGERFERVMADPSIQPYYERYMPFVERLRKLDADGDWPHQEASASGAGMPLGELLALMAECGADVSATDDTLYIRESNESSAVLATPAALAAIKHYKPLLLALHARTPDGDWPSSASDDRLPEAIRL